MAYVNLNTASLVKSDNLNISQQGDIISVDFPSAVASGTDTYTATISGIDAYIEGLTILIEFTNANTTTATLNLNSLGAKTLKKSVTTNLAASDIAAGQAFILYYDGTNFQVIGLGGGGSGSGTVNSGTQYRIPYYSTNPSGTVLDAADAITADKMLKSDGNGVPTHSIYSETDITSGLSAMRMFNALTFN